MRRKGDTSAEGARRRRSTSPDDVQSRADALNRYLDQVHPFRRTEQAS